MQRYPAPPLFLSSGEDMSGDTRICGTLTLRPHRQTSQLYALVSDTTRTLVSWYMSGSADYCIRQEPSDATVTHRDHLPTGQQSPLDERRHTTSHGRDKHPRRGKFSLERHYVPNRTATPVPDRVRSRSLKPHPALRGRIMSTSNRIHLRLLLKQPSVLPQRP